MPFSQATIDFLFENRMRNDREWFHAHKDRYTELVLAPLCELVTALEPAIHAIDPLLICEPKVSRSISRIYRDTRFSKDKSLYRDVMWASFDRKRDLLHHPLPGFFFEISPDGYRYGCGYYEASREVMALLRDRAVARDRRFTEAEKAYRAQKVFQLEGECYKRPRFPDQPAEIREWVERKTLCFLHNGTDRELLFSDRLAGVLARDLALLKPVYDFLIGCELDLGKEM